MADLIAYLDSELEALKNARTLKRERVLVSPQGPIVKVDGIKGDVVMLTSNNYLGLADDPRILAAAKAAIDEYGSGMASVRFICGTQKLHKDLEGAISRFFGTEDAILYLSCFAANEGLFAALLSEEDALISDELNHASIIDGARLSKAVRYRYKHASLPDLEAQLQTSQAQRFRLAITDGVFSMEGEEADLPALLSLCERHDAILAVDESHATGVLGATGRGTPEEQGVHGKIPIITGTLGKAMGCAAGGFITGRKQVVSWLRQKSRPYLFSNSLPPSVAAASLRAFQILESDPSLPQKLRRNTDHFRAGIARLGLKVPHGRHPIVPIIVGDTALAIAMSEELLALGVYVSGFGFPVVPQGQARLRIQISAAHEIEHLDRALSAIEKVARAHGLCGTATSA
ncbi:MAG: glycine C-acetyltransferase [Acidobacteriota bacterium]